MTTRRTPIRTIVNAATMIAQIPLGVIVSTTKILIFVPPNVAQGCTGIKVMDLVFLVSQGNFHPTNFQTQNVKNVTQENGRPKPAPLLPPIVKIVSKADGRPKPALPWNQIVHSVNLVNIKQNPGGPNAKIV